ncbi:3-deoxy-7-phosphoheptulonate synthase [Nocardiopsis quinghaiensis]|uniref:3-deoxy-7-phosphoheptulonate synthase n=1 Tax=Nocardiopsis quinghaiensis TaxID=464995 RepID=UPI0037435574
MSGVLEGKRALVTGGGRGSGRRSPCAWPRTARRWRSATTPTRRRPGARPPWTTGASSPPPNSPTGPTPADTVAELSSYPPLVFAGECDQLREHLGSVARGEAFLLQGGDCAETLDGVTLPSCRGTPSTAGRSRRRPGARIPNGSSAPTTPPPPP